jgi:hypothetical protein
MLSNVKILLFATLSTCSLLGTLDACNANGVTDDDNAPPLAIDANSDSGTPDTASPRDAALDHTVSQPPPDGRTDPNTTDARGDGAATREASSPPIVDAAPDAFDGGHAPTGSACATANAVQSRLCGRCGTEKRLCAASASGDAGAVWLDWGQCLGERADAGLPNTQISFDCERCGKKITTYDSNCNSSVGMCQPAVDAECETGTEEWVLGLSCNAPLGRSRTCSNACKWDTASDCSAYANPNRLAIATLSDAGSNIVSATFTYISNPKIKRLVGVRDLNCPIAEQAFPQGDLTSYAYVEVQNPTSSTAEISLWHTKDDTQMAVYAGSSLPASEAERRNCIPGTMANDYCPAALKALCAPAGQGSTAGVASVTIPPNGSITVYNGVYSPFIGSIPFVLNVRTDSLK